MEAANFLEDSKDAKRVFAQLKPVCVDALRSLSVENLDRFDAALRRLPYLPSPLVEYVLFPLRMGIRRLNGSDKVLLEHLLATLNLGLSRAVPGQFSLPWDIFHELFVFLSMLLDSQMSEGAGFGALTEERSLRALQSLKTVLLSASESCLFQLYKSLAVIGHCVSVLLTSLQSWESREIRTTALTTLLAITGLKMEHIQMFTGQRGDVQDTSDSLMVLQKVVGREGDGNDNGGKMRGGYRGEVLASFLPGVTLAITKLLTTNTNLGQGITNLCLMVCTRYVTLSINDRDMTTITEEDNITTMAAQQMKEHNPMTSSSTLPPTSQKSPSSPTPDQDHTSLGINRSREWITNTDSKLGILAGKMMGVLVTSDGWRRRRGVVMWAHCLLGNCHRSLVAMAPILLEALLALSHDSYHQVSTPALLALDLFSAQHASEVGGELVSVLEERLYSLATSLPRLMRQHDDIRKVSVLQLLAGYLKLLGPHTLTLTHSHSHLSRITQALVQTLELETGDSQLQDISAGLVYQRSEVNDNDTSLSVEREWWTIPLNFKHFRLPEIEILIQNCCQLLGFFGSLSALLDHLLDQYRSPGGRGSELLILIGHVLLGGSGKGCVQGRERPPHSVDKDEMCSLVECVLEEVTGDRWGRGEGEKEGEGEREMVLLQCLQLEVVSVCAHLLGNVLSNHLEGVAYKLLARVGSPHSEVSSRALDTLHTVATCTGERGVAELITSNADYLVNSVSLVLQSHTHTHDQEPLQVLKAILRHGGENVLPLIRDSIDELLLCLDLQIIDNEGVWSVLRSLAAALKRWSPSINEYEDNRGCFDENVGCHGDDENVRLKEVDVVRYFMECREIQRKASQTEAEEKEEGEEDKEDVPEENLSQPVLSPMEQAAVDIMERCPHFLPSLPSPLSHSSLLLPPTVSLYVLDCLSDCLHALRHNQHVLLPHVHKVWPALSLRLSDGSVPVALRALEVLWDMTEVCGDFVRRRVVKGVWPVIAKSLTSLVAGSRNSDQRVYQFTAVFKLQRKMLHTIGILPVKLQVNVTDLEVLVHACIPYLSSRQPHPLVETCQSSLTALVCVYPDIMWLLLHQLVPTATTHPPHPSLYPYKFASASNSDEFANSVPDLLKLTLIINNDVILTS